MKQNRDFLNLKWILKLLFLYSLFAFGGSLVLNAQERQVTGTVTTEEGTTLPGANVMTKGTTIGTITDLDGKYSISVPGDDAILVFSFVGYDSQEIPVGNQTVINIVLVESFTKLDEIVVVGYGQGSRALLTTSVSKMDTKVLDNIPYTTLGSALQGTITGLRIQTTSGQPGYDTRIIMRGGTSIDDPLGQSDPLATGPLIVVDGVIRDNYRDINTSDIESIQLLKDSEAAVYGARSSNGVMIITTKKGQSGKTQVSFNTSMKSSKIQKKYPFVGARDYLYYRRIGTVNVSEKRPQEYPARLNNPGAWGTGNDLTNATAYNVMLLSDDNRYLLDQGWEQMEDPAIPGQTIIFKGVDWQDVLFRTAFSQNYDLAVSGGTENATFRASVGYLSDEGIAIYTDYKRFTFNLAGDLKVSEKLKFNSALYLSHRLDHQVRRNDHIFRRSMANPPTAKFSNPDGTLNTAGGLSKGNPAYYMPKYRTNNTETRAIISFGMDWEPVKNLHIRPQGSIFKEDLLDNTFLESYYQGTSYNATRNADAAYELVWKMQGDIVVNYNTTIAGDHNLGADAVYSFFDDQGYNLSAAGRGAGTDNIPTLNASSERVDIHSSHTRLRIMGYMGRVKYDYKRKYMLSASIRIDGASNLGENSKWGTFPGISAGWNIHNEDFWKPIGPINRLKIRASYGITGNISGISNFESQGAYTITSNYNGGSAIINTKLANPDLQWETSKTLNGGLDINLFNRLDILFDVFTRNTENLLTNVALPHSTGFTSVKTNLGTLQNRGMELEISGNVLRAGDFSLDLGLNVNYTTNKVTKLPDNGLENNRIGGIRIYDPEAQKYIWVEGNQEGQRPGEMYGYEQVGVYQTDAEATEAPTDMLIVVTDKTKYAGDTHWGDIDRNDTIDTRDMIYMGNQYPKWIGGFSLTAGYKGFSLYVRTDFAMGHTICDVMRARGLGNAQGGINAPTEILDSWLQEGDNTMVPRPMTIDQWAQWNHIRTYLDRQGSRMYSKGDYLAIREITLSYNIPSSVVSKIRLSSARVFLTGSNLTYIHSKDFIGFNPELGGYYAAGWGDQAGIYPVPRSFILGLNINF